MMNNMHGQIWGKARTSDLGIDSHPLICHMIDTACVAQALLQRMSPAFLKLLEKNLRMSYLEASVIVSKLAALHDLGKASPHFQYLTLKKYEKHSLDLREIGFKKGVILSNVPHGLLTASFFRDESAGSIFSENQTVQTQLGRMTGAHHGAFPLSANLPYNLKSSDQWRNYRENLISTLSRSFGRSRKIEEPLPAGLAIPITGLISIADWIASNQDYFNFYIWKESISESDQIKEYISSSLQKAEVALKEIGWHKAFISSQMNHASFSQRFGFAPRPLQEATRNVALELQEPQLLIIEAPMGEGKTEAAIDFQQVLLEKGLQQGMYFALPTQATSNQIFYRLLDFFKKNSQSSITINLLHGKRELNEQFLKLLNSPAHDSNQIYNMETEELDSVDDEKINIPLSVLANTWFSTSKKGLLSEYGVGTIDQILMSSIILKHGFLRHFGLAGKVIIFDEVHAYDTYMTTLFGRFLEWAGAMGISVLIMSATLTNSKKHELIKKYLIGKTGKRILKLEIPQAEYPRLTYTDNAEVRVVEFDYDARRELQIKIDKTQKVEMSNAFITEMVDKAQEGARVAFICNTVANAQELYLRVNKMSPRELDVSLLHSRFLFKDRQRIESETLEKFGKKNAKINIGRILISTQIIEQSLDLDFDIMITEFAPLDLILQRAGRLHRHLERNPYRPISEAVLYLIGPEIDLETHMMTFPRGSKYVYDSYYLIKSWLCIEKLDKISLPEEISELVEKAYSSSEAPEWETVLKKMKEDLLEKNETHKISAQNIYIPAPYIPGGDPYFEDFTKYPREEREDVQDFTRLNSNDTTIILVPFNSNFNAWTLSDCINNSLSTKKYRLEGLSFIDAPPHLVNHGFVSNAKIIKLDTLDSKTWLNPRGQRKTLKIDQKLGLTID